MRTKRSIFREPHRTHQRRRQRRCCCCPTCPTGSKRSARQSPIFRQPAPRTQNGSSNTKPIPTCLPTAPVLRIFQTPRPEHARNPQEEADDGGLNFGSLHHQQRRLSSITIRTKSNTAMGSIKVPLNDKREYTAKLIGSGCPIRCRLENRRNGRAARRQNRQSQRFETRRMSLPSAPSGFDNSVTAGIRPAKGRSLPNESYTPFIQTDVAINPATWRPVVQLKKDRSSASTRKYTAGSGGFMGISFCHPD